MTSNQTPQYWRVIDANFNRAKEGLRVCEDIARFVLNDEFLTDGWKSVRHRLSDVLFAWNPQGCWEARNVGGDVGQKHVPAEFKRETIADLAYANAQRVKESIRVLEEFAKLQDAAKAAVFKELRYAVYGFEKKLVEKIASVSGA